MRTDYTPKEIKELLDGVVVGQDELKVCLATQFFLHMKKLEQFKENKGYTDVNASNFKNNILIAGPSGSGKTYTVQKTAELLGLPFISCSATDLTPTGYVGAGLYEVLEEGIKNVEATFPKTESETLGKFTVVFIDEMDKLLLSGDTRKDGDWNKRIMSSLLVAFNGGKMFNPDVKGRASCIDTTNMLFVVAGCFDKFRKRAQEKAKTIGFVTVEQKKKELHDHLLDEKVMPELVGRLTRIVFTEKLSRKEMRDILLGSMGVLASYRRLLMPEGLNPVLSEEAIEKILNSVEETEIGVRALSAILGGMLERDIYDNV